MSRRTSVVLLTFLTLIALTGPAPAHERRKQDPDLPAIDLPGAWRLMTHDAETTDSQCVGDPKTALCAIETILACAIRADNDLCRTAMADPTLPDMFSRGGSRTEFKKYRVISVKKERFKGAFGDNPDGTQRLYTYTLLDVGVMIQPCWVIDKMVCGGHEVPTTYYVLKRPDQW